MSCCLNLLSVWLRSAKPKPIYKCGLSINTHSTQKPQTVGSAVSCGDHLSFPRNQNDGNNHKVIFNLLTSCCTTINIQIIIVNWILQQRLHAEMGVAQNRRIQSPLCRTNGWAPRCVSTTYQHHQKPHARTHAELAARRASYYNTAVPCGASRSIL